MKLKERLVDINAKLQAVHATSSTPELDDLHQSMKAGLDEHYQSLGLSEQDRLDIYAVGTANRGGTPKDGDPA